ncbi:EMP/nonaspanin domain family protein [Reticulomyxa filosa]|uniref:Transmembrane 9 superfamily member n=1 Tax=Reticulomyxa filosa TaxID=46433 RepID=X6NCH2_RETFI|nr:EMP/nonaspanin domain family protein [Reticulomyxa filosa]|eukprot:ETO24005.1 EMP/nonaspanin domain family protein [Reticulomyxa filosa]
MISCALTASLFAGPFLLVFSVVNSIAVYYESSIALPFATILAIVLLWAFVTFPLTAFGSYRGDQAAIETYPCHIKKITKPLPDDLPWYHNNVLLALTAGFLPFMAIYVEVHTIFMSVWGHQPYTLFGILLLTFVILLIVTSFVVILMCYFQLTAEDYRWWWVSIIRGGACGLFMYAYAIYYYMYTARMSGSLQFVMYFGYTLMISYALCLMLGAVGHWSSRWFVIRIYKAIRAD